VPADVVATVLVLQALEGRSDREAVDAGTDGPVSGLNALREMGTLGDGNGGMP
jgi:hypothetical protein